MPGSGSLINDLPMDKGLYYDGLVFKSISTLLVCLNSQANI